MARGVSGKEAAVVVVKKETKRVVCVHTPLWAPFARVWIGYEPVEVICDNWLECQIAAGLIVEMSE